MFSGSLLPASGTTTVLTTVKVPTPIEQQIGIVQEKITNVAIAYGYDPKLAIAIMKCEGEAYKTKGNNKNYDKQGNHWSTDIGLFQINNYYHDAAAKKLGIDIYTDQGNIVYAMYLMQHQGTKPWNASRQCWTKMIS